MASCGHSWSWPVTPEVRALGLGVAALRYASLGYAVLPLEPGGKKPHGMLGDTGGVHLASRDPRVVRAWWSAHPAANIGVPTGLVNQLVVVDLDTKGGYDGPGNFERLRAERGWALPADLAIARTPGDGWHSWFRLPPQASWCPEKPAITAGVDIKGDGGYIAVPPSGRMVHLADSESSRSEEIPVAYEWVTGCPCSPPAAPGWLPGWMAEKRAASPDVPVRQRGTGDDDDLTDIAWRCVHARDDDLKTQKDKQLIPHGKRNEVLYRAGCILMLKHRNEGAAWSRLVAINDTMTAGPLGKRELNVLFRSAAGWSWGRIAELNQVWTASLEATRSLGL